MIQQIGAVVVDESSNWSIRSAVDLPGGTVDLSATQTDAAGEPGTPVTSEIVIDLQASAVATTFDSDALSDTNEVTPTITGTGDTDNTVVLTADTDADGVLDTVVGKAVVGGDSKWSISVNTPLSEGVLNLIATQVNPAGNLNLGKSANDVITIDLTPPAPPTIVDDDILVTTNTTPTLTGTGEVGAQVKVVATQGAMFNKSLGEVTIDNDGNWELDSAIENPDGLPNGTVTLAAIATDAAGNSSDERAINIVVDTQGPTGATIDAVSLNTTNDSTPIITGTGEANATVELFADLNRDGTADVNDPTESVGTAIVGGNQRWSVTPTVVLPTGIVALSVTQTDTALNTSSDSVEGEIEIDQTSPSFPEIELFATQFDDLGLPPGDGVSKDNTFALTLGDSIAGVSITNPGSGYTTAPTVTISGGGNPTDATADAIIDGIVASITVDDGGSGYTTATVAMTGGGAISDATATATIDAGVITEITITDPGSGYTSAPTFTITGDGAAATAFATIDNIVTGLTITDPGKGYTSAPTVTITGDGTAATATATIDKQVESISMSSGGSGYLPNQTSVLLFGGGGSGATAVPVIAGGEITGITVTGSGAGYTSAPTVVINGNGTGAAAVASIGGVLTVVTITDSGTGYTTAPTVTISGGGNPTDATATATIDVVTGEVANIQIIESGSGYTSAPILTITGNATGTASLANEGAKIVLSELEISDGISADKKSFTDKGSLNWTKADTKNVDPGVYVYRATVTDAAGNVGHSNLLQIEIDDTDPATPTVATPTLDAASVPIIQSQTPTITGRGDTGATVEIRATSDDPGTTNGLIGTALVDENGVWSVALVTPLELADPVFTRYELEITQTDEAGLSSAPATKSIVISTVIPGAPAINALLSPSTTE